MIKVYTKKAGTVVNRVLNQLRHGERLRELITRESELNLRSLATWHPTPTRAFLKNLLRLERLAIPVEKMVVPEAIGEVQNEAILCRLGETKFLFGLIDESGALDLRRAGLKREPGYRDLTLEFEDVQQLRELRASFEGKNLEIIQQDPEIRSLTLYRDLWMVRILLFRAEEQKAMALREKNETLFCESRATLLGIAGYLEELSRKFPLEGMLENTEDFPFGYGSPGWLIQRTAELLRPGNSPAADAVLTSLVGKLEKEIDFFETERLRRQNKSQKPQKNKVEVGLLELARRRYDIQFSQDGVWIIPEGTYRKVGTVKQKGKALHHVLEEKVARREKHKIDEISERIQVNAHYVSLLKGIANAIRSSSDINYEQMLLVLEKGYSIYTRGKVRPKFKTQLMLKLALELTKTALICHETAAKARLFYFSASMCNMAARELENLSSNLGDQIVRIAAKQRLSVAIISQNLVRDARLRALADSLIYSLSNRRIMKEASLAWILRNLAAGSLNELEQSEQLELGLGRSVVRVKNLTKLLAKVGRLNREKEKFRDSIQLARRRYSLEKGSYSNSEPLRREVVNTARENLERINKHNEKIVSALAGAIKEALLIKHDLEHKFEDESAESQMQYLEEHDDALTAVARMDKGYVEVVDAKGESMGQAHPYDVRILNLKTRRGT